MPSEVPTRGWDAEIIVDEGEGQYIISEISPKYNDSPACPLSPRSDSQSSRNDLRRWRSPRAHGNDKQGGHSSHGGAPCLPNVISRVFVSAAGVVLECEVG